MRKPAKAADVEDSSSKITEEIQINFKSKTHDKSKRDQTQLNAESTLKLRNGSDNRDISQV